MPSIANCVTWPSVFHFFRWLCLGLLVSVSSCSAVRRHRDHVELLSAGAKAPDFAARDANGAVVHLSQFEGKPRVVYFYPKDETPGCTKEACAFRDAFDKYQALGVLIFGVSRDPEASHDAFRKHHTLPFILAADENGSIQKAYGVPSRKGHSARVTFLVGPNGVIERVWKNVDPAVHASEVLDAVKRS